MNISGSPAATGASTYSATGEPSAGRERTSGEGAIAEGVREVLGKDDFLKLLTTQLRFQDPLKPIDDQNFIAQMAQFSALEQMQNLTTQLERFMSEERVANRMAQATALLGREVEARDEDGFVQGTVRAVRLIDGTPWLLIGDTLYDVADVIAVV